MGSFSGKEWLFFDLDGTLVDSVPALYGAYLDFLEEFGIKGDNSEFEKLIGPSLSEIVRILKEKYNLELDFDSLLGIYNNKISEAYDKHVVPFEGSEQVLKSLKEKGKKLCLVTSSNRENAFKLIEKLNWDCYFDSCVFGDEVSEAKPAPEIYKSALDKTRALPSSVVVVEDSPNGVKSAKNADIDVVGFGSNSSEKSLRESGANMVVSELKDILFVI
ncbi:hypothetical protein CMI47_15245 [Candidatus Pacearchaeota archaeon]|nr:hypothetical protein [Candidatus Pacearchaeota archaeon]|tara:strand:- start:4285 stop:4938 length:654 start_codon:yes stop_codon:yes gene_type:complete